MKHGALGQDLDGFEGLLDLEEANIGVVVKVQLEFPVGFIAQALQVFTT